MHYRRALYGIIWGGILAAQVKYSNEFLKIGVGARAAGLGNAQVAAVSDATAGYWNPGALPVVPPYPQLILMHSEYFASVAKYDYGTLAFPLQETRRVSISFIRLGIDDIPNTLRFYDGNSYDFSRITKFSVADMALYLSYAQPLRDTTLSIGGSFKVIHRLLGPFATAWGFGMDLGLLYRKGPWRAGVALYDATSTFNAWTFNTETFEEAFILTGNAIPQNSVEWTRPSLRLGGSVHIWQSRRVSIMPALDWVIFTDGMRNTLLKSRPFSADLSVGIELRYRDWVALRGGMTNFQQARQWNGRRYLTFYPTAGIGFRIWHFGVDYALANFTGFSQGLYSHLVSLRLDFHPTLTKGIFSRGG
ncbi:MAG: PorV/PorQ family protein [Bacteroidia bacterium]|nr:PorV/PorQ family protein [Bacteroidia bacterium]MDW8133574.1 PorV/PorQ family protein [Bacteroidia bacterium]